MKAFTDYITEGKSDTIKIYDDTEFIAIEENGDKTKEIIQFNKSNAKDYAFEATEEVLKLKVGQAFYDSEIIFVRLK